MANLQAVTLGKSFRKGMGLKKFYKQLDVQSMIWPGIIFMIIFNYIPMYGIIIAFKDYSIISGFMEAPWVGFKHFTDFLTNEKFYRALGNTLGINIIGLFFSFPAPIIFALLLNEVTNQRFKQFTQSVSYLPHFLSWVIYGGLIMNILAVDTGIINGVLLKIGAIKEPIFFLGEPKYFWFLAVSTQITKGLGWGAIIYLAAIAGVDQQLYEAAIIDGAGRFKRMYYVTLPSISGTVVILLIFAIAGILNSGFDQIWMLQNSLNVSASEVIDTYVYKMGLKQMRFSFATAMGLSRSIIALILLLLANYTSKQVADKGLF